MKKSPAKVTGKLHRTATIGRAVLSLHLARIAADFTRRGLPRRFRFPVKIG
jgi:hypothetical protein